MGFAGDSGDQGHQPHPSADTPVVGAGSLDLSDQQLVSVPDQQVSRFTLWVHRLSLVILVVFCIELGMLLAVLPWTRVWTDNTLLVSYPGLSRVLRNEFARGAITGLGLLDIWIGIWEAVHYSDPGKPRVSARLR